MITTLTVWCDMALAFPGIWTRRGIIGAALLALALLAGCSAVRLGYGQLPTLAYWWIDGHVDFDDEQSPRVREALRRWVDWHQRTQLQGYAAHLARVRAEAALPVSGAQVCRLNDATRELLDPAIERAVVAAAAIVPTLSPQQIDHIDARFRKRTDEMRAEMLPADAAQRRKAAVTRTVKRFETFYGSLGDEQRRIVEDALRSSPSDAQAWFAQRELRHREMLETFRAIRAESPPAAVVQERLRLLARRFDGRAPIAAPERSAALVAHNCELAARVHNSATAEQRRHLADKLSGWEADLRALARPEAPALARETTSLARP